MVAQVLFAGTEGEIYPVTVSGFSTTLTAAEYDSNFSRLACSLGNGLTGQVGPNFGGLSQIGYHFKNGQTTPGNNFTITVVDIQTSTGQTILRLRQNDNAFNLAWCLQYWNGSAFVNIGSFVAYGALMVGAPIDIFCKIHATLGEFSWWLNGNKIATLTGNTNFFSATIDKVVLGNINPFGSMYTSEHCMTDVAPVGVRVMTLPVTGAGSTNTFSSGVAADIDDTSINDADFLSSLTANQVATFAAANLSTQAAALLPLAYCVPFRASIGATGPQNAQAALRSGSTNYFGGNVAGLTTSFKGGFNNVWNLDPDTGVAWTVAGMNAAEPGAKSIT